MKFAVVNGERQQAQPDLSGACPACARPMVARCGEIKVWHWAHQGTRVCDPWWENETEWHRAWKNRFPNDWQEVVHKAENGEKHIADVKTDHGWVIEIQHSYLKPEERRSRNGFYKKLVWVVDGTRRKTDSKQFLKALNSGTPLGSTFPIRRVLLDECSLLREWGDTGTPVFFDFGGGPSLWWLFAKGSSGCAYVAPFSREDFVGLHCNGATKMACDFHALVGDLGKLVENYEIQLRAQSSRQAISQPQYLPRSRVRRRF
jgi:competence protein CoiA